MLLWMPCSLSSSLRPCSRGSAPCPSGPAALSRLNAAVVPVARMELAGITLDRDGLTKQADAWDEELARLKMPIAVSGSQTLRAARRSRLGSSPDCSLDTETGSNWLATWPRTARRALHQG